MFDFKEQDTLLFDDTNWVRRQLVNYLDLTEPSDINIVGSILNACSFNEICSGIQNFQKKAEENAVTDYLIKIYEQFL